MDVSVIMKILGIGLTVSVSCQILSKYGRDDQASLLGIAGLVIVLMFLVGQIENLLDSLKSAFGI
ncbi:MAG: stage III sporulation AC/AD family protein [Clostridia bacterium]|nr:stage III sporulation AC/AD family protein [Clostridia bacterium]